MSTRFAIIVCALISLSTTINAAQFDIIELHCLKEFGYDKNIIVQEENRLVEGNAEMNIFFSCVWKKKGLQHPDGTIDFNNVYGMIVSDLKLRLSDFGSAYVAVETIKKCKDVQGSDHGDTAVKMYNCLFEKVVEHINEFQNNFDSISLT